MNRDLYSWLCVLGATFGFIGATAGASGWIFGAAGELETAGYGSEAQLVSLCAAGVLLTGGILGAARLAGLRLNLLVVIEVLLGASLLFGSLALWIMWGRGVLASAVDASGQYPESLAFAAPVALLAIMILLGCTPLRKRLGSVRL